MEQWVRQLEEPVKNEKEKSFYQYQKYEGEERVDDDGESVR